MSYRELWVLVQHLPQESWTQTILRDQQFAELVNPATTEDSQPAKFGPWALFNYQMAALTDAVNRLHYLTAVVGHVDPKPEPPEPTPRPGLRRELADVVNTELAEAQVLYLDKLRARG